MERILFIRGGAIGDFIVTLPAVELVKQRWPDARVEVLGYPSIAELGLDRHYFDAVRSMDHRGLSSFFIPDTILDPDWMDYFASFDLVISYLYDPDEFFETNVRKCGPGRYLGISPKVREGKPAARHLAGPLAELELCLKSPAAKLHPNDEDKQVADDFLRKTFPNFDTYTAGFTVVHPGSGSEKKNLPLERWTSLMNILLQDYPGCALFVGGEAEGDKLDRAMEQLDVAPPSRVATATLPLPVLAAVLQRARCFFGHDSGISHLAAAVGTPVIALFGPTDAATWAPQGGYVSVIQKASGNLDDITKEDVLYPLGWLLEGSTPPDAE